MEDRDIIEKFCSTMEKLRTLQPSTLNNYRRQLYRLKKNTGKSLSEIDRNDILNHIEIISLGEKSKPSRETVERIENMLLRCAKNLQLEVFDEGSYIFSINPEDFTPKLREIAKYAGMENYQDICVNMLRSIKATHTARELGLVSSQKLMRHASLQFRASQYYTDPALFLNKQRKKRISNKGIEYIFSDELTERAGIRYYTPLNFLETSLCLLLSKFNEDQEHEEESKGVATLMKLTGVKYSTRISKIKDKLTTDIADVMLPYE